MRDPLTIAQEDVRETLQLSGSLKKGWDFAKGKESRDIGKSGPAHDMRGFDDFETGPAKRDHDRDQEIRGSHIADVGRPHDLEILWERLNSDPWSKGLLDGAGFFGTEIPAILAQTTDQLHRLNPQARQTMQPPSCSTDAPQSGHAPISSE